MNTVADAMTTSPHLQERRDARPSREDHVGARLLRGTRNRRGRVPDHDAERLRRCLCAYTQGKVLAQIPVTCAAPARVQVVRTEDSLDFAHELMRKHHIRCLPVLEKTGRLIGILSISDIIRTTSLQGEPRLSANSIEASPRSPADASRDRSRPDGRVRSR